MSDTTHDWTSLASALPQIAAGLSGIVGAGVALASSGEWPLAALIMLVVWIGVSNWIEVRQCRASHRRCDRRVASAHTAIAILHRELHGRGGPIPSLDQLLGDDAHRAIIEARRAQGVVDAEAAR